MATDLTASNLQLGGKDHSREAGDKTAATMGFWAASIAAVLTITFLALTLLFPGDEWAGIEAYAEAFETSQVAQLIPVLLLAPVVVILISCIHAVSPDAKRVLTHLAVVFSAIYATIICANYILQLFVVRLNVVAGDADGLTLLAMSNPRSIFVGLEILGYGFFGLMALFASTAFGDAGIERWIRRLLVVTGLTGMIGAVSGVADQRLAMLSGFGLSLLAFLAAVVLLSIYLHALVRKTESGHNLPSQGLAGEGIKMFRVLDTHIDIDAPPERVWEVLLDFPPWKEWNPFITSVAGTLEVGARLHITVSPPGIKPMEFKPKVFAVRPCKEILWGGSFLLLIYRGDHAFLLEPLPGGGTRFRQRERFMGPMVLFMSGMIKATEQGYHQMNQALKRRVESSNQQDQTALSPHGEPREAEERIRQWTG